MTYKKAPMLRNYLKAEETVKYSFVVLYGSQLGQAEYIAKNFVEVSQQYGFSAICFTLNEAKDLAELSKVTIPIVIVASTTGDGDPPENADVFWRKIRKKNLKSDTLKGLKFTVLGLGDTNFNQFCNCGKEIRRKLGELGAEEFYPSGWADDAIGLELVIEDWTDGLWEALESTGGGKTVNIMEVARNNMQLVLTLPALPKQFLKVEYVPEAPAEHDVLSMDHPLMDSKICPVRITDISKLSYDGANKRTYEFTFSFKKNSFEFEPGDAIGIICPNPCDEVESILRRLNCADEDSNKKLNFSVREEKGKIPSHLPTNYSLKQIFTHFVDIRSPPKKGFLRMLAEFCTDEVDKNELYFLCSRQGAQEYDEKIRIPGLSLLDLLLTYPSCQPSISSLLEHLGKLLPRAYSIASSPLNNSEKFKISFNLIDFPKREGRKYYRLGICTGFLYNAAMSAGMLDSKHLNGQETLVDSLRSLRIHEEKTHDLFEIYVYKRKNHNFRLPSNYEAPVIMVGPGTGVAPFIGFMEHRLAQDLPSPGMMHLYFGCRNEDHFLYKEKLKFFEKDGILKKLYVSFSRNETEDPKYVQDFIEKNKTEFVEILFDHSGYLYVCGDAKNMAKDVREKVTSCIVSVKGFTQQEAKDAVKDLISSKRYLQDIWL